MVKQPALLFSLAALAAGCATTHTGSGPETNDAPADVYSGVDDIDANLARLANLDVFEVGELVVEVPDQAYNCYGPCPGYENAEAEALDDAAGRLGAFTAAAIDAAGDPGNADIDVEASLTAIEDLGVISVGDMITSEPENSCAPYFCVSPEEQARVDAENAARRAQLDAIVVATAE